MVQTRGEGGRWRGWGRGAVEPSTLKTYPYILLLMMIWGLNLLDSSLTLRLTEAGLATEANPLMEHLLSIGPLPFFLVKLIAGTAGVALLWRARLAAETRGAAAAVGVTYAAIGGIHGAFILLG